MNKQGFLRIVEASVAILIIISVLFIFFNQQRVFEEPDISEKARDILEELSQDLELREAVIAEDNETVTAFITTRITEPYLSFETRICAIESACGKNTYTPGDVYSAERVISSTIHTLGPKKIRLFIWYNE